MIELFLADLKGYTQDEIREPVANEYAGEGSGFDYGYPSNKEQRTLLEELRQHTFILVYESVGDYGCDSSSYFLMLNHKDGKYYEFSGSHCSCYGFEGQYDPVEAPLGYLLSDRFSIPCGGYDDECSENQNVAKTFIHKYFK